LIDKFLSSTLGVAESTLPRGEPEEMKTIVGLVCAFLVAGCATGGAKEGGAVATFVHSNTGDTKVCYEQNPGLLTALCIPCGFAQAGSAFADCKSDLEGKGYERHKASQ